MTLNYILLQPTMTFWVYYFGFNYKYTCVFMCVCEFICPVEARKGVNTPGNEITGSSKHPDMDAESHTDVSSEGAVDTLTH